MFLLIAGLSIRDNQQEPPQIVAVLQQRELAISSPRQHALQRVQNNIVFISDSFRRMSQVPASQFNEPCKVAVRRAAV